MALDVGTNARSGASLLVRALVGIGLLVFGTTGAAWLMHASIESEVDRAVAGSAAPSLKGPLADVRSWSTVPLGGGATGDVDLLVVDPAAVAPGEPSSLPAALDALKRRPDGRQREVVARVSLATRADERTGVRLADFWSAEWQAGLFGSSGALIDRIAAAGYDGVYIGDGDAYLAARSQHVSAEADFVDLVARVASRAKSINPDFAIILGNAEELYAHQAVRESVDALARENLLFGGDEAGSANPRSAVVASLHFLSRARRDGRPVFVSERLDAGRDREEAHKILMQQGFVGLIQPLSLTASVRTR